MASTVKMPKPRLIQFNSLPVTDHNRAELQVSVERIETKSRMASGIMRKYHVADKHTFSTSWDMLPNTTAFTVDGHAGADDIESFYLATEGAFTLTLSYGQGLDRQYTVMFTDFQKTLQKRGRFDFYSVSVTLEEV